MTVSTEVTIEQLSRDDGKFLRTVTLMEAAQYLDKFQDSTNLPGIVDALLAGVAMTTPAFFFVRRKAVR